VGRPEGARSTSTTLATRATKNASWCETPRRSGFWTDGISDVAAVIFGADLPHFARRIHTVPGERGELDSEGKDEDGWRSDRRVDILLD
jgi:hypothetical protein